MISIAQNINQIQQRIQTAAMLVGRNPQSIHLLAVSKTRTVEEVINALEAGQKDFGENYLDDAIGKIQHIGNRATWHFIGPVQSNKTRDIALHFDWVHSIDRIKIATRLNAQRPDSFPPLNICLQVNTSMEASKSGVQPEELLSLAEAVNTLPKLNLRGLMTIPAAEADVDKQKAPFRLLHQLQQQLNHEPIKTGSLNIDTLSMGMSNDFETAISQGATIVRIGTAIFGSRN